jgi:hypothetical protein
MQPFWCHKGLVDGEPRHVCRGWLTMVATKDGAP